MIDWLSRPTGKLFADWVLVKAVSGCLALI
jgi:hypothetical protein